MLSKIIAMANFYDLVNQSKKADRLDNFVKKVIASGKEPTIEELMQEEKWLENEDLSDQSLLEGLTGEDLAQAQAYLASLEELQTQDLEREQQQQETLSDLSRLLQNVKKTPDMLPYQMPITPEASITQDFAKLADILDQHGLTKHADFFDRYLSKIAAEPPDDDDDFDDDNHHRSWEDELDELDEPSTEELLEIEGEPDMAMSEMLSFVSQLAEGMFISLEAAVTAAKEVLKKYDQEFNIPDLEDLEIEDDEDLFEDETPSNVIEFPSDSNIIEFPKK